MGVSQATRAYGPPKQEIFLSVVKVLKVLGLVPNHTQRMFWASKAHIRDDIHVNEKFQIGRKFMSRFCMIV